MKNSQGFLKSAWSLWLKIISTVSYNGSGVYFGEGLLANNKSLCFIYRKPQVQSLASQIVRVSNNPWKFLERCYYSESTIWCVWLNIEQLHRFMGPLGLFLLLKTLNIKISTTKHYMNMLLCYHDSLQHNYFWRNSLGQESLLCKNTFSYRGQWFEC